MKKFLKIGLLVFAVITVSGCATILRGEKTKVYIVTDPPGSVVTTSNGKHFVSPCIVEVSRSSIPTMHISKDGYKSQFIQFTRSTSAFWLLFNVCTCELGWLVDMSTGAVYDIEPNQLEIKLQKYEQ